MGNTDWAKTLLYGGGCLEDVASALDTEIGALYCNCC